MRKIHIDNVLPGMKLAKAAFNAEGRILLTSAMELKDSYIERLRSSGVAEVYIEDEISKDVEVSDVIYENTRVEAKVHIKNLMKSYTFANPINSDKVRDIINKIVDELLSNEEIIINLSDIKSVDDYTFEHSVNVCILSLITGIGLGYNMLRLKDLGVGAILHDIGKLRIPEEILKKPSQLTVEE